MNLDTLRVELAGKQYAGLSDQAAADLLNAPGALTVSRGVISRDEFLRPLARGMVTLLAKPLPELAGWLALLQLVRTVDTGDAVHAEALAMGVTAGVWTPEEVEVALTRSCSKSEALYEAEASAGDVAEALHEGRQAVYEAQQAALREHAEKLIAENPEMELREALERADQAINGHTEWGHK